MRLDLRRDWRAAAADRVITRICDIQVSEDIDGDNNRLIESRCAARPIGRSSAERKAGGRGHLCRAEDQFPDGAAERVCNVKVAGTFERDSRRAIEPGGRSNPVRRAWVACDTSDRLNECTAR